MANKFIPDYIEEDINKFHPDRKDTLEVEHLISNQKSVLQGDDLLLNDAAGQVGLSMSTQRAQLERYKQQQVESAKAGQVQHIIDRAIRGEEVDPQELQEELLNPAEGYRYYQALVRSNDDGAALSNDQVKNVAANLYTRNLIASATDDAGIMETVANVAGLIALPRQTYVLAKTFPEELGSTAIDSGDFVVNFARRFRDLPPEQKIEVAREVFDRTKSATDNELLQLTQLVDLLGSDVVSEDVAKTSYFLDKIDVATFGLAGVGAATALIKGRRALNAVKNAKNIEKVAELADAGMRDATIATKLGANQSDIANTVDANKAIILEGADPALTKKIVDKWQKQDDYTSRINDLTSEGIGISDADIDAAITSTSAKVERELRNAGNNVIYNEGMLDEAGNIKIRSTILEADGNMSQIDTSRSLKYDDIHDVFINPENNFVVSNLTSPNFYFGKNRDRLVQAYERLGYQSAAINKALTSQFNNITRGLGKSSLGKLDNLLKYGDEQEAVYSVSQLMTTGVNGIQLSKKEAVAYAQTRHMFDELWRLEDSALSAQFRAQGLKKINTSPAYQGQGRQTVYAKPYDSIDAARTAYTKEATHKLVKLPVIGDSKVKALSVAELEDYYNDGFVLTRAIKSENNLFDAQGTKVMWSLEEAGNISDITGGVLNYRKGYIPKIGDKEYWFVKSRNTGSATFEYGDDLESSFTLATAATKDDAEKFAMRYNATKTADEAEALVLSDREVEQVLAGENVVKQYGGLFTGARSTRHIPHIVGGQEGPREFINVYEAMQRNINHIAKRLPMAEYRIGNEKVWLNTAAQHVPNWKLDNISFDEAAAMIADPVLTPGIPARQRNFLITSARQIRYINGVHTLGEEAFKASMQGAGLAMESAGKKLSKLGVPGAKGLGDEMAKYMYANKSRDPITAVKGATFHLFLGMGNPAQYFIQGSGATIAMSMHPISAARVLPKIPMYTVLDNIPNPATRRRAAYALESKMKSVGLLRKDSTFADDYLAWNSTGIREGIIHTNVDAVSVYNSHPIDVLGAHKFMQTAGKLSTAPYSAGELVNARMSYFIALDRAKRAAKGRKLTADELKGVVSRAEQFRLNMNNANKAEYQKGFWAVTTQFMSVNARFFEALMGGQFTAFERFKLIAGQAALFGALGIPMADYLAKNMLESVGVEPTDDVAGMYYEAREGVMGYLLTQMGAEGVDVVPRIALGEGFAQQVLSLAAEESYPPLLLIGPSASSGKKALEVIQGVVNSTKMMMSADEMEAGDFNTLLGLYKDWLVELPSSTAKARVALDVMENRMLQDKYGRPILFSDPTKLEEILLLVGFNPKELQDYYAANISMIKDSRKKSKELKQVFKQWSKLTTQIQEGKIDAARASQLFTSFITSSYSPADLPEFLSYIQEQAVLGNDPNLDIVLKVLEDSHSELLTNSTKFSNIMLRFGKEQGETE